jgi:MurNAc alpha-1-phosphate uridylyltransferase
MTKITTTAMILAAGYGKRMQPLTLTKPKPLQLVGDRTMLDYALDKLVGVGTQRAVVNTFYLAEQIEEHLRHRKDIEIIISRETELLDTGGGVKNALRYFDDQPFFVLNADLPWMDGPTPSLMRMAEMWDAAKMDALLLLMPTLRARGFPPKGSFALDAEGRVHRHNIQPPFPYVMISAQILKPELFAKTSERIFSNNIIWDDAEARGKLCGIEHDGTCYHVGTSEDLAQANDLLSSGQGWGVSA